VLIRGSQVTAVGRDLAVPAGFRGEIIDGVGRIVLPGLVNAHLHTWQTSLRGLAANWTLPEYFRWTHRGLASSFTPQDIHASTLAGALAQLDRGVTTLVDWCHNNPTPEHTDAAVDALVEAGIRAAFFHGSPKPDPKPGQPHFSRIPHPRSEAERLLAESRFRPPGLLTLGLAVLGPHYSTADVAVADLELAAETGLVASMHQGGGDPVDVTAWSAVEAADLLGPRINVVHGNDLDDSRLDRLVDSGVTFTVAAENELTQGHGFPVTGRLLRRGVQPSLGADTEAVVSGDMFQQLRFALGLQRGFDNQDSRQRAGDLPPTSTVTTREVLEWATVAGAKMLGLEDRIGAIRPGMQADLVLLRSTDLNLWPVDDAVNAVVMHAHGGNVDAVMVAGAFVKRSGRLLRPDLDRVRAAVAESGARLLGDLMPHSR
jgi:5-methylthioadenosine/S-adenosylhomocysteine deaminase